jgi:hypothetical protein
MRPAVRAFEDRNSCDYCRCYLATCRLIAGGADDHRQFCSFVCYDRSRAEEAEPDARFSDLFATARSN